MKEPLIILTGPTAVGKTKLSIALAKAVNGEIISADSMQVYKHMDIGSAKIMPEEMDGVRHYLVDELEPFEEFHVVRFQEMAKSAMKEIRSRGHIPILVGGTGFYIQAVVRDIDFTENEASPYRAELEALAEEKGSTWLHEELRKVDPESAEAIHPNNIKRVIRALEYFQSTGQKFSDHNKEERQKGSPYNFLYLVLIMNRKVLYERIDKRVDQMMEEGLVKEVKQLLDAGYSRNLVSMQGLGYKEIASALFKECTMEEAVYRLKRDTRHFAKRQMTWFRRERDVTMINKDNFSNNHEIVNYIMKLAVEKGICLCREG